MTSTFLPATILIVEDEGIIAKDLQQTLIGLGYDAFAIAASSDEAVARASIRRPDIVLMDIRIKGNADGIETAEILKSMFRTPIIYLTANTDQSIIERARETAPEGYLRKPVNTEDLHRIIQATLARHRPP